MTNDTATALIAQLGARVQALFVRLADPKALARLQTVLLLVLLVWGAHSAARLLWTLWPTPDTAQPGAETINPAVAMGASRRQLSVDLEAMLGLGLFGDPINETTVAPTETASTENPRDGIESGARETRLDLVLTGIVASTEDGLGTAVIEAKGGQLAYAVGDDLPVSGKVTLAKVMPTQVVIDNNGTYELLRLFDDNGLSAELAKSAAKVEAPVVKPASRPLSGSPKAQRVDNQEAAALAASYRDQLYDNPQSLADVVKVSAVRGPEGLRGYRVAPGSDARQFKALGFQSGDIVTAVNGLALSDPTNTMRLYQLMRDATEATFDVERDGGALTIAVGLGGAAQE